MTDSTAVDALRDAVRDVYNDRLKIDALQRLVNGGARIDEALWRTAAELGWLGIMLPEQYGGSGLGFGALAAVYEESGRYLAPLPLLPTALCAEALVAGGSDAQRKAWLPAIASGKCIGSVSSPSDALDGHVPSLTRKGSSVVLNGVAGGLLSPSGAGLLIVFAMDETKAIVAVAIESARDGVPIDIFDAGDLTRHLGEVPFNALELTADRVLPGDGRQLADKLLAHGSLALACDAVGGAARIFELTIEYLKTREQFGRPIGSFQALKHRAADLKVVMEVSAATVREALVQAEMAGANDVARWASMAKFQGCDAYAKIAGDAIQLHGGIGFTWEHYCHLFLKRARLNQQLYGGSEWHRDRAARLIFGKEAA
jgi:alkylation response protein AidB-like acyl-CoA dehydrogenase